MGVDGPGVAGVDAVVMIGVKMRFVLCSSMRKGELASIVAVALRDVATMPVDCLIAAHAVMCDLWGTRLKCDFR